MNKKIFDSYSNKRYNITKIGICTSYPEISKATNIGLCTILKGIRELKEKGAIDMFRYNTTGKIFIILKENFRYISEK